MSEIEDVLPPCPECAEPYVYEQGALLVCPMCGHEWSPEQIEDDTDEAIIRDAVGNVLADGDTVTLVKTVKVSGGGGGTVKIGTKVPGIRLNPGGAGGHDIEARVPGFGNMQLKSSVVKRAN